MTLQKMSPKRVLKLTVSSDCTRKGRRGYISCMENKLAGKSPSDSAVTMTELVLPSDTNALGSIFGGKVMSWIDIAGAISAGKHSRRVVVTASIDALHFLAPIKLGHVVHIKAIVNYTSR